MYIPIDGTFIENLIFNNLFYKILDIQKDKKEKSSFMSDFGIPFENYVSNLISFTCENNKVYNYTYIPEFTYKYQKNKLKSPDVMIFDSQNNVLLVIEVKSARVLNTVTTSVNTDMEIEASYEKIKGKP